jgi:hypothetical protein
VHSRPFRSLTAFTLTTALACAVAFQALAAGAKDKEAQKLLDQAMQEDYLSLELEKAEKKLDDALKKCGKDGCSKPLVAKVHVALATIYGASNKLDKAKEELVAALAADPNAALDPSFTTPELAKAFKEAQAAGGGATGGGEEHGGGEEAPKPKKAPGGDIAHTPVAEQVVNTPVPVYIEIPEEYAAEKATLKYKPFGGKSWKTVEMKKMGAGFGAEIPCEDVTTTGDVKYYIIAIDGGGEPAGQAGSLKAPYKVSIKNEIDGVAPSLPGKKAPDQCKAKEDCPPGLPGCPDKTSSGKHGDKGWGDSCEESAECKEGYICLNGSCEEGTESSEPKSSSKTKKNLVGISGALDFLLIGGAEGVCNGNDPSYACFRQGTDRQYFSKNANVSQTNAIQGGFGVAGGRAMLTYDRLLSEKLGLSAGARLGFAFGGSPTPASSDHPLKEGQSVASSFLPVHGELRLSYSFGKSLFELKKIRPYIFVGGGLAQVNASVPVTVCATTDSKGHALGSVDSKGICKGKGKATQLDAYQVTGLNFIGFGAGAVYALTPTFGVSAELKAMVMMTTTGLVFEPTIGPVFAF